MISKTVLVKLGEDIDKTLRENAETDQKIILYFYGDIKKIL